jgi:trehalose synthase
MKSALNKYKKFCDKKVLELICTRAHKLEGKHIVFISSTYQGGGVAEMLNSLIYLFNEIGVKVGWRILHGTIDFFVITKKLHNALQGEKINLSQRKKLIYNETNRRFSVFTHIEHDMVVVHDPQPLPLINFYKKTQPWVFRCHIDISDPNLEAWSYLKTFMDKYDRIVVSKDEYKRDLQIPHTVIYPAIDPLTMKNRNLPQKTITKTLMKYGINTDKPIIAQISRFDKWKDPLGVIKIFEKVRAKVNCTLVLLGSLADDDPEGGLIYEKTRKSAEKSKYKSDIKILLVNSDILVNCLQRKAAVIIQKSIREGFGLVVAEALYKGTPVVASNVGGIPFQVIDNVNGYLVDPDDLKGFAAKIILLLNDEKLRSDFAKNGTAHIKNNFLITRLLSDWLSVFEQTILAKSLKGIDKTSQVL